MTVKITDLINANGANQGGSSVSISTVGVGVGVGVGLDPHAHSHPHSHPMTNGPGGDANSTVTVDSASLLASGNNGSGPNGAAHLMGPHSHSHSHAHSHNQMSVSSMAPGQMVMPQNPVNVSFAPPNFNIIDVWESNLEDVFAKIRTIIDTHYYVAMDTEFPGVVARPQGQFKSHSDYAYQSVRCNVELLKIIQLGFAFFNEEGELHSCYQFNFKFNINEDMFAKESIDLLQSSGIQFNRLEDDGVNIHHFAELLIVSGLVLIDNVKWISFHSSYDYGYLLRLLCNKNLPETEDEFYSLLQVYFPIIYDVKFLMKSCKALKGGLSDIGEQLEVARIGPEHQAGSDSILTAMIFFKMVKVYFEDHLDDDQYAGQLYGLGANK